MRSTGAVTAALFLSLAARSIPVTAQERPILEPRLSFEVASVKVIDQRARSPMQWQPPGHFTSGVPLLSLLSIGYQIPVYRIEKVPDWVRTTLFEINARTERPVAIEERPAYYRGLLAERFNVAVHIEPREMDVYTLTVARSDGRLGPNLRRVDMNCDAIIAENRARNLAGERLPGAPPPGARPVCGAVGGVTSMTAGAAELAPLLGMLAQALGRPVLDKTGLVGRFDFDFKAAPPNALPNGPLADLPPVSTALEDQLGLKLERGRGSVDVLVIDRLDMPTDN
jgi:uncharacterized protein (TIGR03435 family)